MCCVLLFIEGVTKICPSAQHFLTSLPALPYLMHYTFANILHHCVTYSFHTFPNSNSTFSSLHTLPSTLQPFQFCSPHPPVHRSLLNSPHVTNENSTFSLCIITHYTPLVYNLSTSLLILQQPSLASEHNWFFFMGFVEQLYCTYSLLNAYVDMSNTH